MSGKSRPTTACGLSLEANHLNEWVVVHSGRLVGAYATFGAAAEEATKRFGRDPYLIKQVGARPLRLPISVQLRGRVHV